MDEMASPCVRRRLYNAVVFFLLLVGTFGFTIYSVASDDASDNDSESDSAVHSLNVLRSVKLTDQHGQRVNVDDLHDKVVMTNFFFTACGSACPLQTSVLRDVEKNIDESVDAVFISISISPLMDNQAVVAEYIEKYSVSRSNWLFATASVKDTKVLIETFGVTPDGAVTVEDQIDHRNMGYLFDRNGSLMQQYQLVPGIAKRISKEMKMLFELNTGPA